MSTKKKFTAFIRVGVEATSPEDAVNLATMEFAGRGTGHVELYDGGAMYIYEEMDLGAVTPQATGRGFQRADFIDANGEVCSIQESSTATEAMLWLGQNTGTHHMGACLSRMHLTRAHVAALLPLLLRFVSIGEISEEEESKENEL